MEMTSSLFAASLKISERSFMSVPSASVEICECAKLKVSKRCCNFCSTCCAAVSVWFAICSAARWAACSIEASHLVDGRLKLVLKLLLEFLTPGVLHIGQLIVNFLMRPGQSGVQFGGQLLEHRGHCCFAFCLDALNGFPLQFFDLRDACSAH